MLTIVNSENLAGEIATHNLIKVDGNTSVLDASKLMRKSGMSELLVTREANGRLWAFGVVTASDFVTRVMAAGLDPSVLTTGDIARLRMPDAGGALYYDEKRGPSEDN